MIKIASCCLLTFTGKMVKTEVFYSTAYHFDIEDLLSTKPSNLYETTKTAKDVLQEETRLSGKILMSLLLLSYHRRLRMTQETLEQCMEGGRVSQSGRMCVVSHSYGGFGRGMEVVVYKHAGQSQGGVVACREMLEHFKSAR